MSDREERTGYRSGDPAFRPPRPNSRGSGPGAGQGTSAFACDLCGAPMLDRHCKLTCLRCGYQRDCSDP